MMLKRRAIVRLVHVLLGSLVAIGAVGGESLTAHEPPPDREAGFWRSYWYEPGAAHGNLQPNSRFRVNAPETSLDEEFGGRSEARGSGMMQIYIDEDLRKLDGAELYAEFWGGHPGTDSKRVSINGRRTYRIPDVGTADGNCTHQYPRLPLRLDDLVNGYNAVQFACSQGAAFWGHYIVDNACLRVKLPADHPDLAKQGLAGFEARLSAEPAAGKEETIRITLDVPARFRRSVQAVSFQAEYDGYDENGDAHWDDWHGYTKSRRPAGVLTLGGRPRYTADWDTSMLPRQGPVRVQAIVEFQGWPELSYVTPPVAGPEIERSGDVTVRFFTSEDMPRPFWSRAGNVKECTIDIDVDPAKIEKAELHVVTWTGGAGNVAEYFKLNGQHIPVAEGSRHETFYAKFEIGPQLLKRGKNTIRLLSDTEHHGIEILRPGPAIAIRYRQ